MSEYLLTASEVAKTLRISKSFAYQLMNQGEIPTIHIGRSVRVRPEDLEKFIESKAQRQNAVEYI